ncbi:regulatory protein RecX [Myxococcaceae bacterium JPH2]|nr:regulatory protein RecX [Myxococcaceae bacterium JPH2]
MVPELEGPEAVNRATDACLRLLSVRARSRHELLLALERKGYAAPVRDAVLERLLALGYVDDERFAQERARALLERGKFGPRAVLQRLQAHGLAPEVARRAVGAASGEVEFDAEATARQVLTRRGLLGRTLDAKEVARAARLLTSRGFSPDVIRAVLGHPSLDPSGLDE